jgi:hypothetical protein
MIKLYPPAGGRAAPSRVHLLAGGCVFPNRQDGNSVRVHDEADAIDLESRGWRRDAAAVKAASENAVLRKAADAVELRRYFGNGAAPVTKASFPTDSELRELGEARQLERLPHSSGSAIVKRKRVKVENIKIGDDGIATVEYDAEQNGIIIAGVGTDLDELEADQRAAFIDAAATLGSEVDEAATRTARRAIADVVRQVLQRDKFLNATVRERIRATA